MKTGLLGVVVCGGKSLRMGTDKGLIPIGNTCWASLMASKLTDAGLPVVVSVNSSQLLKYNAVFKPDQLIVDSVKIDGPIAGLLTVHLQHQAADLLLIACDMIDLEINTIRHLMAAQKQEPDYDFYVYQNDGFAEPFCAIYTSNGLINLTDRREGLQGSDNSFQSVFKQGVTKRLPIIEPNSFANYNSL